MSILKIENPHKRDRLVKELLQTRKNIQRNNLKERVGDIESERKFEKIYKPITTLTETIPQAIEKGIQHLALPEPRNVPALPPPSTITLGPLARTHLSTHKGDSPDTTFGIHATNDGKLLMGNTEIKVDNDDIIIGDKRYEGTRGLWELIASKRPKTFTEKDYENYAEILIKTNAILRDNDPNQTKASGGWKWKNIVAPIWNEHIKSRGPMSSTPSRRYLPTPPPRRSIAENIERSFSDDSQSGSFIQEPSNTDELIKRLDLLMASKVAGNTGVTEELIKIVNKLLKNKAINSDQHRNLVLKINN